MPGAGSRPLSAGERAQLLVGCLPFAFFAGATIFVATAWSGITAQLNGPRTPLVLVGVMLLVLLVTGWGALRRVRDLVSGVAVVARDELTTMFRGRRGASNQHCFGTFADLGTLRMSTRDFHRIGAERATGEVPELASEGSGPVGTRAYEVAYSPHSRLAWTVHRV